MFSFGKDERLCHKKEIEDLFLQGKTFLIYPFKVFWSSAEMVSSHFPSRILISIPKKNFKRAVKRNLLKRRSREAYRLNKALLIQHLISKEKSINIAMVYISKDINRFDVIEKKIIQVLKKIIVELEDETST
jgi:ribonuclease P protein component